MRKLRLHFTILFCLIWLAIPGLTSAQSVDEVTIRAVLFYSPTCPHCHYVITEVLEPMMKEYGDQLQIAGIDTTQPGGGQLYQAAIERYQIPQERRGVPTLIVGDTVLVGSGEIPEQFPALVEQGLAAGGFDWPDIPGFDQLLPPEDQSSAPSTSTPEATLDSTTPPPSASTPTAAALIIGEDTLPPSTENEVLAPNPAGFILAGLVFIGMFMAVSYTIWQVAASWSQLVHLDRYPITYSQSWITPLLLLIGFGVAVYLTSVEVGQVEAVCGPIGDCHQVQASPYAQIFGIPVGLLGAINYLVGGILWVGHKYLDNRLANLSALGFLGLTVFGTLFSIYLTYLELFVIQAICVWCLSSAIITTILMLLIVKPTRGNLSQAGYQQYVVN